MKSISNAPAGGGELDLNGGSLEVLRSNQYNLLGFEYYDSNDDRYSLYFNDDGKNAMYKNGTIVYETGKPVAIRSYQVGRYSIAANGVQDITVDLTQVTNGKVTLDLICSAATQGIQYLNVVRGDSNKFRISSSVAQDVTIIALILCY